MSNINNANIIKALLVDFLIEENIIEDCLFGNEVFYGFKKRQTDFLAVNGSTTAFEIKSESDDFRKLRSQLNDYKKVFDYQYLVTTRQKEKKAKSHLAYNEGLIIINDDLTISIKRKPKKILRQDKAEILETMPLSFLKRYFNLSSSKTSAATRSHLKSLPLSELREALKHFLKERLSNRNDLFFSERGQFTHIEDLKLLSTDINLAL